MNIILTVNGYSEETKTTRIVAENVSQIDGELIVALLNERAGHVGHFALVANDHQIALQRAKHVIGQMRQSAIQLGDN